MTSFITREYDYAIRICAYLAGNIKNSPISVARIAKALYLTRPFTTKIIFKLRKKNIVGTVQGKEGGIFLNQPPEKLTIFAILRAMGFNSTINECIQNPAICPLIATCKIHSFFIQQESIIINNFKNTKIAEFAFSNRDLKPMIS